MLFIVLRQTPTFLQVTLAKGLIGRNHIFTFNFPLGIDSRVKMISGIIIHGSYKRIFGVARDNICHVVSRDGLIWTCIMPEEWQQESSSNNFVHAIFIPKNIKGDLPEDKFVASNNDGTVSYGGKMKQF